MKSNTLPFICILNIAGEINPVLSTIQFTYSSNIPETKNLFWRLRVDRGYQVTHQFDEASCFLACPIFFLQFRHSGAPHLVSDKRT